MFVPILPTGPLEVLKGCNKLCPEPSLLQAEQPQLSQPFPAGEVFHPFDHYCDLLWSSSNRSMSVWGLQSWMQDSRWGFFGTDVYPHISTLPCICPSWIRPYLFLNKLPDYDNFILTCPYLILYKILTKVLSLPLWIINDNDDSSLLIIHCQNSLMENPLRIYFHLYLFCQ